MLDERTLLAHLHIMGPATFYVAHSTSDLVYTSGVEFLARNADAHWLVDLIASWQSLAARDRRLRRFQAWEVTADGGPVLVRCYRYLDEVAFHQEVEAPAFPLRRLTLYVEDGILLLPSER